MVSKPKMNAWAFLLVTEGKDNDVLYKATIHKEKVGGKRILLQMKQTIFMTSMKGSLIAS